MFAGLRHDNFRYWRLTIAAVLLLFCGVSQGHPDDEFCVPGESGLDPALCDALAALDSASAAPDDPRLKALGIDGLSDLTLDRSVGEAFALYVGIGVGHILPGGLDHILFVLALVIAAHSLRSLVIQVTSFTVAHTVTLALAATGTIPPLSAWVEPLIAFTIVFVAVENTWRSTASRWRPAVVFAFGLVHGLGFAGFFGELGLPQNQFWAALLGFNVGVEIGQLAVVALVLAAFIGVRPWLKQLNSREYRHRIVVVPGSLLIALLAAYWTIERSVQLL